MNVGIDIGGTKANIGIVQKGEIIDSIRIPTGSEIAPELLIEKISKTLHQILEKNNLSEKSINSIGVGVPGTASIETGFVEFCPNLGWENVEAGNLFKQYFSGDVFVSQDSRLAAWAEYLFGAGRGSKSSICITLGTGIGAGIIINGEIFHGAMNTAGELGHTVLVKNGRPCTCGNNGCLERYCSGSAIIQRALELYLHKFDHLPKETITVFELAYKNDQEMLSLINAVVEDLAVGIANAVSIISPEVIILSGGLCEHEKLIIEPLKKLVNHFGYYVWTTKKQLKIVKAELGENAPMIGAAYLFKSFS